MPIRKHGLRVALVNLTNGGLSGGSVKYLRRVVPLLRDHPCVRHLDVFVPPDTLHDEDLGGPTRSWNASDLFYGFRGLRRQLRTLTPDVVFIPNARWFDCGPTPVVTMVRNMEPFVAPAGNNSFAESVRNVARRHAAQVASTRSTSVIAVSNFVRNVLTAKWKLDPLKISVVYHGADSPESAAPSRQPAAWSTAPGSRFLFVAGSIRPYRGLEDAIRALAIVRGFRRDVFLVIAGSVDRPSSQYALSLRELARACRVEDSVFWAGQLSGDEMAWCYRNASVFLMTSRVEACPNAALEAMSWGLPCVACDVPPMPEFFSDSALYYPVGDAHVLAERVGQLLNSPANCAKAAKSARARAARYTWENTADRTLDVLRKAIPAANR